MNLARAFAQLNLGTIHSKIYETVLKHKHLTILELAKLTNIARSTCYEYLPELVDKGLVSLDKKGKSTIITAETPQKLIDFLKLRVEEVKYEYNFLLERKEELIADFSNEEQSQAVMQYTNLSKLAKIFAQILSANETIQLYSQGTVEIKAGLDFYHKYFDFPAVLREKNIHTREILEANNLSLAYRNNYYSEIQKIQLFSSEVVGYSDRIDKFITGKAVLIIEPLSEKITCLPIPAVIQLEKNTFKMLWQKLIKSAAAA